MKLKKNGTSISFLGSGSRTLFEFEMINLFYNMSAWMFSGKASFFVLFLKLLYVKQKGFPSGQTCVKSVLFFLFFLYSAWSCFPLLIRWQIYSSWCKPSLCRFARTEASTGRFPSTTVWPAANGDSDSHSAGPPVGHVCSEAQCHEGGCYWCPQGTLTDTTSLFVCFFHSFSHDLSSFRLICLSS